MNINAKCRIIVLAIAATAASAALAMPTKSDFAKAQPIVNELMNPLVKDFKANKTTAAEVGAKAVEYAREAETEAAKFMLLKGAITYYSRAEQYDKAADAVDELSRTVKDIPPDTMLDIISRATSRISEANAPRLHAQYRLASSRAQAEKEIAKLKPLVAKRQADDTLRRRYAEALAASGNWKAALDEFAKAKGTLGEIAAADKSGKGKAGDIAEFWWGYKPEEQYVAESMVIKWHAAEFYKKALAEGSLSGLKKTLAEKRIAEANQYFDKLLPIVPNSGSATPPAEPVVTKGGVWTLPKTFQTPLERSLDLGGGVTMPFCACPAGSFEMFDHKVTITRPFWFTKTPVTLKQYLALPIDWKPILVSAEKVNEEFNDKNIIVVIVWLEQTPKALNKKYKNILPPGYVFRFASEAELFYAYGAGKGGGEIAACDDRVLVKSRNALAERGMLPREVLNDKCTSWWGNIGKEYGWARFAELPEANVFGVVPWHGAATKHPMLDKVDIKGLVDLNYADEEIDPLRMTGKNPLTCWDPLGRRFSDSGLWGCLSLVIGPDLEAEKTAVKK